jgi:hypothetical protein
MSQPPGPIQPVTPPLGEVQPTPNDKARLWLMIILAGTFASTVLGSLMWAAIAGMSLSSWLNPVLPAITGLVGGAVGFYFGQQSQNQGQGGA